MVALVSLLPGVSVRRRFTLTLVVAMATVAGTLLPCSRTTQPFGFLFWERPRSYF